MKIRLTLCLALISAAIMGNLHAQTDVTNSLELLGNPAMSKWPSAPYARNVWALKYFQGKIFIGSGNSANEGPSTNAGPAPIYTYQLATGLFETEWMPGTSPITGYAEGSEQNEIFRPLSDGRLYMPYHDPRSGVSFDYAYRESNGTWVEKKSFGYLSYHAYDIAEWDGKFFLCGNTTHAAYGKTLGGLMTKTGLLSSYGFDALARVERFLPFDDALYLSCYNYTDNGKYLYYWDSANDKFTRSQYSVNQAGHQVGRMHAVEKFSGNRIAYTVGSPHNDHQILPTAAYVAQKSSGDNITFTKLSLPSGKLPWDIKVVNDTVYILLSDAISTSGTMYNYIWKYSGSGRTGSSILKFKATTLARSFEYVDGCFYFGMGTEHTGTYVANTTVLMPESGNIMRLSWPLESGPAIVADPAVLEIKEGESAKFNVTLDKAPSADTEVSLAIDGMETDIGFTPAKLTFTAANWNVPQTVTVTANPDDDSVSDQTFIRLAGQNLTSTLVCVREIDSGNPGEIVFADPSLLTVNEGTETYRITVRRQGGSDGIATVNYNGQTISGLTAATSGSDYVAVNGTLTWADGDTEDKVLELTIKEDDLYEGDEYFVLRLYSPTAAKLGAAYTKTVKIVDNDAIPTISFKTAAQTVAESVGTANVEVVLSGACGSTLTVPFLYTGTATATSDYTAAASINIAAGSKTGTLAVTIVNDTTAENNETLVIQLGAVNALRGSPDTHTITITDNDGGSGVNDAGSTGETGAGSIVFSASSFSVSENAGVAKITVKRTGGWSGAASVDYETVTNNSATENVDYVPTSGTLNWADGDTTDQYFYITLKDDSIYEGGENFRIRLTNVSGAVLGSPNSVLVMILDDETKPKVSFDSFTSSVLEGTTSTIKVRLDKPAAKAINVPFTVSGSAVSGQDYTAYQTLSVTFPAGSTEAEIPFTSLADDESDPDETVILTLGTSSLADIGGTAYHTITIEDNQEPPVVNFAAASKNTLENSGTVKIGVTLSFATSKSVIVPFTVSGSAVSGQDYTAFSSTSVTVQPGETTAEIAVTLLNNALDEDNRTLVLTLGTPVNANAGTVRTHTLTILDDDATPSASFVSSSQSFTENSGSATVQIRLSAASARTVTVPFTLSGTAKANRDYTAPANLYVTFAPGETLASVTLPVIDNALDENNRTLILTLGACTNANKSSPYVHTITIVDDDDLPTVAFALAAQSIAENAAVPSVSVEVRLSAVSGRAVTIPLRVSGTAVKGTDYTLSAETLSIPAGQLSGTVEITVKDNHLDEPDKTAVLSFGTLSNADKGSPNSHTLTIVDDDVAGVLNLSPAAVKTDEKAGSVTLTVDRTGGSDGEAQVKYATVDGTARAGQDYTAQSGTLRWAHGETGAKTITIAIADDGVYEAEESFRVVLSDPSGATLGEHFESTVTVADVTDLPAYQFAVESQTVGEDAGTVRIEVTLTKPSQEYPVVIPFTLSGTAQKNSDYRVLDLFVAVPKGKTSATIPLMIVNDRKPEPTESVILTLGKGTHATPGLRLTHTVNSPGSTRSTPTAAASSNSPTAKFPPRRAANSS